MSELSISKLRVDGNLVCGNCEKKVHPNRNGRTHFEHNAGSNKYCEWHTNYLRNPNRVSAQIHHGVQKGPVHEAIQQEFYNFLKVDDLVKRVPPPDSYFKVDDKKHGRFPDINVFLKSGKQIAFEIQIKPIQVPDIIARHNYYMSKKTDICWVFSELDPNKTRSFQNDIIAIQNYVAYSVDRETREVSIEKQQLFIRALYPQYRYERNGKLKLYYSQQVITFHELIMSTDHENMKARAFSSIDNYNKFKIHSQNVLLNFYQPKIILKKDRISKFITYWSDEIMKTLPKEWEIEDSLKYKQFLKSIIKESGVVIKLEDLYQDMQFHQIISAIISFKKIRWWGLAF